MITKLFIEILNQKILLEVLKLVLYS